MEDRYISKTIGGVEYKLHKRTWRHRARIQESAKAFHKQAYSDNLRLAGYDGDDLLPMLTAFDKRPLTVEQWLDYIVSDAGVGEALSLALPKDVDSDTVIDAALEDGTALAIVAELWGITFAKPEESPASEPAEDTPDPTNPPTFPNAPAGT